MKPGPLLYNSDVGHTSTDRIGLCATCAHARVVASARASTFYLCRLSEVDPRFRRYPVLPVRSCTGYEPQKPAAPKI